MLAAVIQNNLYHNAMTIMMKAKYPMLPVMLVLRLALMRAPLKIYRRVRKERGERRKLLRVWRRCLIA